MDLTNKNNILEVITEAGITEEIYVLKFFKINSVDKKYIIYKKMNNSLVFASEVIDKKDFYKLEKIEDKKVLNTIHKYMKEEII